MDNEIKILDLGEASALIAVGFELLRLEETPKPKQRAFVFPSTLESSERGSDSTPSIISAFDTLRSYSNHDLNVDARKLYESIRGLKSKLHKDIEAAGT